MRASRLAFYLTLLLLPFWSNHVFAEGTIAGEHIWYTDLVVYLPDLFMLVTLGLWLWELLLTQGPVPSLGPRATVLGASLALLVILALLGVLPAGQKLPALYHALWLLPLLAFFLYILADRPDLAVSLSLLAAVGSLVFAELRGARLPLRVAATPFVPNTYKR